MFAAVVIPQVGANAKAMDEIIAGCSDLQPFPSFAACVKETYNQKGDSKKSGPVLAFYAYLDEITEDYVKSQGGAEPMTDVKARAATFRAWQTTIDASISARRAAIAASVGRSTAATSDDKLTVCNPKPGGGVICTSH
ncbi:hypothetical protein ASD39_18005 [Sphingomonas sp. Root50]|nr:hypothetical protein ASD17_20890 [Sphingomonas sp. Root1294]KQY72686.1 hypothetical protein ASD39_18005 [Sphingomonas sp. Root50]KRB87688.1 hypothetical protein ASE22_23570 [Sphingomonas sp. Root720]